MFSFYQRKKLNTLKMKKKFKFPFFIAEISANHNGSISHAKKLIKCAKDNGADAVKFQTFEPHSMTINLDIKKFKISEGLWKNYTLWDLYKVAQTPFKWQKELFDYARNIKIKCFSTPFDEQGLAVLEKLKCPIYKVSSYEIDDYPLLKAIALKQKPMIISTGTASFDTVKKSISYIKKFTNAPIAVLYCVSIYPSSFEDFNMNNIKILKEKFNCTVGLSDHSKDVLVATTAVSKGAEIIEKHIALQNQKKGVDIDFALKGKEIKDFVEAIVNTKKMISNENYFKSKTELKNSFYRRSIYAIKNIKKGEFFTKENIKCLRPRLGLKPEYYSKLINKKAQRNITYGSPIKKTDLFFKS